MCYSVFCRSRQLRWKTRPVLILCNTLPNLTIAENTHHSSNHWLIYTRVLLTKHSCAEHSNLGSPAWYWKKMKTHTAFNKYMYSIIKCVHQKPHFIMCRLSWQLTVKLSPALAVVVVSVWNDLRLRLMYSVAIAVRPYVAYFTRDECASLINVFINYVQINCILRLREQWT
jgi:hypothetical protein